MFEMFLIISLYYILIELVYFGGVFPFEEDDVNNTRYLVLGTSFIICVYIDQVGKAGRRI
jgi:hypothetical protein